MKVDLKEESKDIIQKIIDSGQFYSPEDVIDAALRLLIIDGDNDAEIGPRLLKELIESSDSLIRGEGTEYDNKSLMDLAGQVTEEGRKRKNIVVS